MLHRALYVNMRKFQRNILASFSLPLETAPAMGWAECSFKVGPSHVIQTNVQVQLGSQGSSIEWRLVIKSTKSLHYVTSDMFCLTNNLSFWIFDTNLPIVPGGVSFYLPRTLQLEKCGQRATSTEKNECKFCCHCYQYFINQLLYCTLLLIIQIVFHGFNDSVDEAGVKIRSTPVTFVLFDDLLNKVSRHVWLVRIVNSFWWSDLVTIV